MNPCIALLLLILITTSAESAKILGIFHFPSKSHYILGTALLRELAERGHEVTMVSPYLLENPIKNYEEVELTGILDYTKKNAIPIIQMQNMSNIKRMGAVKAFIETVTEMALNHTAIADLLNTGRSFHLVIQNWFFNHAFLGIAHNFKAPVIAFVTHTTTNSANKITGNPNPPAYVPFIFSAYSTNMNFFERLGNTFAHLTSDIYDHFVFEPVQEGLLKTHFPKAPPLEELVENVSLVLVNSHFSIDNPRPYMPNMVQIGGFHLGNAEEISGELKLFLDSATEGVLFFSLGSNLRLDDMGKETLQGIIRTFGKLPLKVLWKFESDDIPKMPENVMVGKWLPQREILAHRNTKVFVTHGGMLSITEAIYYGVPMVGIPFFADQFTNIAEAVNNGYAVQVPSTDLTEPTLTKAILEIITHPTYRENIKIRSDALRDQPIKPLDKAVYWVEYVLRHRGAPYLQAKATELKWYQYFLLDVALFVLGALCVGSCLFLFILKVLHRFVRRLFFKACVKRKSE